MLVQHHQTLASCLLQAVNKKGCNPYLSTPLDVRCEVGGVLRRGCAWTQQTGRAAYRWKKEVMGDISDLSPFEFRARKRGFVTHELGYTIKAKSLS